MTLIELVKYFRSGGSFEAFCQRNSLNPKAEVVEIYAKSPINQDNDLAFFEIESTGGKTQYTSNGEVYVNLFDFYYFQDAIGESNSDENLTLSDEVIAKRLFDYAINDA